MDREQQNSTAAPYPSDEAMEAAISIEVMVACGGYKTVAYGRAIQKAIGKALTTANDVFASDIEGLHKIVENQKAEIAKWQRIAGNLSSDGGRAG